MTVWVFYLLLVIFSDAEFSLFWLLISVLFSGSEVAYKYKYTSNPALDGKSVR